MIIKVKPSNIFDIGKPNITDFFVDKVVLTSRTYQRAQGSLSNAVSVTLFEPQYNSSGVLSGFTDVRNKIQENFDGTVNINGSLTTFSNIKFSINQIANLDSRNYFSIRETTTYGYMSGGTGERTLFLREGSVGNDREVTFSRSISQNGVAYPIRVTWVVDGVYVRSIEDTVESVKTSQGNWGNNLDLPRNEMVQSTNLFGADFTSLDYRTKYNEMFLNEVFEQYSKERKIISLLLGVGKYYDTNGNLVIDADSANESTPPLIRKYDIIEPYRMSNFGEIPLENKASGEAKQFEVLAVNFSYKGISRQEIIAREIS